MLFSLNYPNFFYFTNLFIYLFLAVASDHIIPGPNCEKIVKLII